MRRVAAALAVLTVAGCGTDSPDLFEVRRSGKDRAANVRLLVSDDGTASCNGGKSRALSGDQLLEARELARRLEAQAALAIELPAEKNSTLRYVVRTSSGRVAFSDTSRGRPRTFDRLVAFSKTVIEDLCKIRR